MKKYFISFLFLLFTCQVVSAQHLKRGAKYMEKKKYYYAIAEYLSAYNRAVNNKNKLESLFKLGDCYRLLGDNKMAIHYYKRLASLKFDKAEQAKEYVEQLSKDTLPKSGGAEQVYLISQTNAKRFSSVVEVAMGVIPEPGKLDSFIVIVREFEVEMVYGNFKNVYQIRLVSNGERHENFLPAKKGQKTYSLYRIESGSFKGISFDVDRGEIDFFYWISSAPFGTGTAHWRIAELGYLKIR